MAAFTATREIFMMHSRMPLLWMLSVEQLCWTKDHQDGSQQKRASVASDARVCLSLTRACALGAEPSVSQVHRRWRCFLPYLQADSAKQTRI